jgi:molecular chaperone DnaJ
LPFGSKEKSPKRGDLYVKIKGINSSSDGKFKRDGTSVLSTEEIGYLDAILGTTLKAETIDGDYVEIKIPSGTQGNTQFRIKGKGAAISSSGIASKNRGDQIVTIQVKIPSSSDLTEKEKELLKQLIHLRKSWP